MAEDIETNVDAPKGATFHYAARDFLDGYRLNQRPRRRQLVLAAICFAVFVAVLFVFEPDWGARAFFAACGAFGGVLGFGLQRYVYLPWMARRSFETYPLARIETTVIADADGLRITSPRTDSRLLWSDLVAWQADAKSVLVYTSPRIFMVIPTRLAQLGLPLDTLKAALAKNTPRRR